MLRCTIVCARERLCLTAQRSGCWRAQEGQKGVLIRRVEPTSPASKALEKGDVLLSFDGIDIASDGTVPFRSGERISFSYLVSLKFTGDQVKRVLLAIHHFIFHQSYLMLQMGLDQFEWSNLRHLQAKSNLRRLAHEPARRMDSVFSIGESFVYPSLVFRWAWKCSLANLSSSHRPKAGIRYVCWPLPFHLVKISNARRCGAETLQAGGCSICSVLTACLIQTMQTNLKSMNWLSLHQCIACTPPADCVSS